MWLVTAKHTLKIAVLCSLASLTSCASSPEFHSSCVNETDQAWKELSIAKAKGFSGTINYTKALSLLTAARAMQLTKNFNSCQRNAKQARIYIRDSYKNH